jgi:hypothetical protein
MNQIADLIKAAETCATWMQSWIEQAACECEDDHICGIPEREAELEELRTAIEAARGENSMSNHEIMALKERGKKKIKIMESTTDKNIFYLEKTSNGWCWASFEIDQELLEMIHEATGDALKMLREQSAHTENSR